MAKKKVINTSKTAHVMNLISKNYDSAPEAAPTAEEEAAAQAEAAAVQGETAPLGAVTPAAGTAVPVEPATADTPTAPTLPLLSADMEITAQIKSALEDLVEDAPVSETEGEEPPAAEEEPVSETETEENPAPAAEEEPVSGAETEENPAPAAEEEPVSETETEENPAPAAEEAPASETEAEENPAPAAEEAPVSETEAEENPAPAAEEAPVSEAEAEENPTPAAEEEPAPKAKATPDQDDPEENVCINIMQELVEQSVDHYIKMFGLCTCSRCKADVKAIALTNLVPQYVVAPRREASFRVTIYHERFHGEVTAQILQACKIVMDNPRH